jgi:hypothetical protein
MTPSFTVGERLVESGERGKRMLVPEEILAYQKLSPLRKFLGINKNFRDKASIEV